MISRILEIAKDCAGAVIVEFAAVLPVLLLLLVGVLQFGLFFYQYTALTEATAAGIRQFSISRLDANGYNDTVNAIIDASSNLTITSSMITLAVNGTACTTNSGCASALVTAAQQGQTGNIQPLTVTVSYPCTPLMPTSWVNLSGICPLTMTLATVAQ